jgi:endo-1,4-beta-xylanase
MFGEDFYIGAALTKDQILEKDERALTILKKYFNSITADNAMKWECIHPGPNEYDFELADRFVELGKKNHMFVVGHALLWHEQIPDWVFRDESGNQADRDTLLQRMHDHIFTLMKRYKGRTNGWDVVNEVLDDSGRFRKTKWIEIIGEDYIQKAFEFAHEADPEAELYYNDFSLTNPQKRNSAIRLIRNLQSKGIKIDAIGEQGHYQLDYPDVKELENTIIKFSELGINVMITELDVSVLPSPGEYHGADISLNFKLKKEYNPYPDSLPDSIQQELAKRYGELFRIFHKHRDKISRVTIWGIHDETSWLNNWPVKGRTNYPLLFDRQYNPKPALEAVIQSMKD